MRARVAGDERRLAEQPVLVEHVVGGALVVRVHGGAQVAVEEAHHEREQVRVTTDRLDTELARLERDQVGDVARVTEALAEQRRY